MLAVFQVLSVRKKNLQVHLFNMAVLNQDYDYINIDLR
jgi:5-carboxymethyl-2-hydroxymuconate isomerase